MSEQKIDRNFHRMMESINKMQNMFKPDGNFASMIAKQGGDVTIFREVNEAFDSLYDSLESAHYDAVGHKGVNETRESVKIMEGVLDSTDEDGWMAKGQLYNAAQYSIELHKMIQDTDNLEPWVQAKITKAADYLSSVKHYMEYEAVNDYPEMAPEPEMEEGAGMTTSLRPKARPTMGAPATGDTAPSGAPTTSLRPKARPTKRIGGMPGGSTRGIDPRDNYSPADLKRLLQQSELPEADDEALWMEKMAAAGLRSVEEGKMSDVAAAADQVASMISAGASDEEIMDSTGLNSAQIKFLRNQVEDRPGQYDEGKYKNDAQRKAVHANKAEK